jgi:hypothetical protein
MQRMRRKPLVLVLPRGQEHVRAVIGRNDRPIKLSLACWPRPFHPAIGARRARLNGGQLDTKCPDPLLYFAGKEFLFTVGLSSLNRERHLLDYAVRYPCHARHPIKGATAPPSVRNRKLKDTPAPTVLLVCVIVFSKKDRCSLFGSEHLCASVFVMGGEWTNSRQRRTSRMRCWHCWPLDV